MMIIIDIIDNYDINNDVIVGGSTPLSQLVKSDSSDVEYAVDYINKTWSCTCKAFVYSKTQPQTCKHINKIKYKDFDEETKRLDIIHNTIFPHFGSRLKISELGER